MSPVCRWTHSLLTGYCYACFCILCTMRFRPTTYAFSTLHQRFICIHLLKAYLTLCRAFSLSVHHSSFTAFAAQSGLVTPPVQRYRHFATGSTPIVVSSLLQHVKERQSFLIFTAQAKHARGYKSESNCQNAGYI
jgi:hypothetical protein